MQPALRRLALRGSDGLETAWIVRVLTLTAAGVLLIVIAAEWLAVIQHPGALGREFGGDYRIYMDAARRWLSGGSFYSPYQFAGPYELVQPAILYPPTILPLLVPFTFLPAVLWWLIPVAIIVACIAKHRPAMWTWPLMLLGLAWPQTGADLINGTPTLWILASIALASHWGWPGSLVLVKPSVAPFALIGIRTRGWWVAAVLMALLSVALLPLWLDWITVIRHGAGPRANLLYSVIDAPILAIPVVAWVGRRRYHVFAPK
jgi:hypothetical protein